jgi:hypothetical protein
MRCRRQWRRLGRRHCALLPRGKIVFGAIFTNGARNAHGKRRSNKMHKLVVSCLVVAYLSANVYAIVKVRVFELGRSRKHLLFYGVPFILWGSLILLGCKLIEIMRRFDEWAA